MLRDSFKMYRSTGLVFLLSLVALALVYQVPFTYTLNLGQNSDDWAILRGFGDREQNDTFSFRWTVQAQAELRLPDVGWPSRVGLVGLAPRPDGTVPNMVLTTDKAFPLAFSPANASLPPAEDGRLTFEVGGSAPSFRLSPNRFLISSDLFQPSNEPRSLGLVVSQVYLKPQPSRFGLIVPPLAQWLGWAIALSLLYLSLAMALRRSYRYLRYLVVGLGLVLVIVAQLLFPEWLAVNGTSLAWGLALPLGVWTLVGRWRVVGLVGQLVLGIGLVYYGLALAPLTLTQFGVTGILLLVLALPHRFSSHLENIGLLTCLTAPVGWLLWQGRLPRAIDLITYHLPWINELDYLIRQGNLYPRWTPDFVWQQGWTTFNFYPPVSRYLPELLHLAGLTINNAVLLTAYITLLVAIIGCYFWCQEVLKDGRAALLGALAFCYLPYRFVDFFSSGTLSNYMGGALLPWVVWLLTCLVRYPTKARYPLALGLVGAILALTSTPQLLIFLPVVVVYLPGLFSFENKIGSLDWRRVGARLVLAGGLAFGLSAFFLLPSTLELNQVGLKFAKTSLDDSSRLWANASSPFDFWHPILPSFGAINSFATLPFWLALAGFLFLMIYRPLLRPYLGLLAVVTTWAVFLQFPVSRFFWQTFSVFTSVQFSSRLLYSTAIFAAPLIGGLALSSKLRSGRLLTGLTSLLALGLMLYACFYELSCPYWPPSFDGTISQRSLIEQIGNADVMYLPKGTEITEITKFNKAGFEDGRTIGTTDQLNWEITGTDNYRLTARLSQEGVVTVPIFWFEGWWKVRDEQGHEYQTNPASVTHHLRLTLPSGEHHLVIQLQDTPLRLLGYGLTLFTLFALFGYIMVLLRSKRRRLATSTPPVLEPVLQK